LLSERKVKVNFLRVELYSYLKNKQILSEEDVNTNTYLYLKWITDSIDKALEILSTTMCGDQKVKLIKDKYLEGHILKNDELSGKHYVHYNTLLTWDNEFLDILSRTLGLKLNHDYDKIKLTARR